MVELDTSNRKKTVLASLTKQPPPTGLPLNIPWSVQMYRMSTLLPISLYGNLQNNDNVA